jgi:hypothetical protein
MHRPIPLLHRHTPLHHNRRLRLRHNTIPHPPILHLLTIHTRRQSSIIYPRPNLISALHVHVFEIEGVNMPWKIAEEREKEVDEEVGAAAGDEEDA